MSVYFLCRVSWKSRFSSTVKENTENWFATAVCWRTVLSGKVLLPYVHTTEWKASHFPFIFDKLANAHPQVATEMVATRTRDKLQVTWASDLSPASANIGLVSIAFQLCLWFSLFSPPAEQQRRLSASTSFDPQNYTAVVMDETSK